MKEPLFNKVAGLRPATLLKKKTLAQVFSCGFCDISKNTFFTENLRATDSVSNSSYFEDDLFKLSKY